MGKGKSINLAAIFGGIAIGREERRGTARSRIRGFEMEDSPMSFMKVDVRGEPHCETKRFHRKASGASERVGELLTCRRIMGRQLLCDKRGHLKEGAKL